jgi:DNA-binding MarR family transcriptional regulator
MGDDLSSTEVELFGSLFVFMQVLTLRVEERLAPFGLTSRQWLLLGVIEKAFPGHAPTISEATAAFGTSRQNVKQVAVQLERRGWLRLEPDPADARVLRLALTEQLAVFQEAGVQADQAGFILDVFEGLTPRERRTLLDLVTRCITNLSSPTSESGPRAIRKDER